MSIAVLRKEKKVLRKVQKLESGKIHKYKETINYFSFVSKNHNFNIQGDLLKFVVNKKQRYKLYLNGYEIIYYNLLGYISFEIHNFSYITESEKFKKFIKNSSEGDVLYIDCVKEEKNENRQIEANSRRN